MYTHNLANEPAKQLFGANVTKANNYYDDDEYYDTTTVVNRRRNTNEIVVWSLLGAPKESKQFNSASGFPYDVIQYMYWV